MNRENLGVDKKTIMITGCAGFIGSNLVIRLAQSGYAICLIGIDNLNNYYDVGLKKYRLCKIEKATERTKKVFWNFIKGSIADKIFIDEIFKKYKPDIVVNLAAQAGVRY